MNTTRNDPSVFVPGKNKAAVPFMRDVFTIPTNARRRPRLIGSVCQECEEYFFPKTGAKTTCDNPVCPRSTSEVLLSGKGRLLSATVTRSSASGDGERVSAVILLEEGIKINSHLIGWEGYRDMLVPGSPVELALQDLGENEWGETQVGYAFRLVTGRRKPASPAGEGKTPAAPAKKKRAESPAKSGPRARTKRTASAKKTAAAPKKETAARRKAASKKTASAKGEATPPKKAAPAAGKAASARKPAAKAAGAAGGETAAKKPAARKTATRRTASKSAGKRR